MRNSSEVALIVASLLKRSGLTRARINNKTLEKLGLVFYYP